jgi:hypothetical protein
MIAAGLAVAPALALPDAAASQASRLVVEAHGGMTVPVGSFTTGSGGGASPHASLGVEFALPGGGRWAPYLGFGQHRFGCEDAGCAEGGLYVATSFHGGMRVALLPRASIIPWLRVGAHAASVETDALPGSPAGLSKLGLGGEAGAGVHIGRTSQIALNPGVRVVAVNTTLPGDVRLRMRYLVADLAVVLSF